jgi:hypothetical protein
VARDPGRGIPLVAAADALVEDAGGQHGDYEARMREEAISAARAALGDTRFDRAYTEGRELSLDDAVRAAGAA